MLIFLVVLSDSAWLLRRSPGPNLTMFEELLLSLGLAAPPAVKSVSDAWI